MVLFLPTTKSRLRIASLSVVLAFSTSRYFSFVTAFQSTGLSSSGTTISPTNQRRRQPQLPPASPAFSSAFSAKQPRVAFPSASTTTVLYRIRCENKYYQLEELEDADNCTTELFLKSNGVVGTCGTTQYNHNRRNWNFEFNFLQLLSLVSLTFLHVNSFFLSFLVSFFFVRSFPKNILCNLNSM